MLSFPSFGLGQEMVPGRDDLLTQEQTRFSLMQSNAFKPPCGNGSEPFLGKNGRAQPLLV